MNDFNFWLQYGLAIFFVGLLATMILVVIIQVEYKEYKKRKNKK